MLIARKTKEVAELDNCNKDTVIRNDWHRYIKIGVKTYNSVKHHKRGTTKTPYQIFWVRKKDVIDYFNWKKGEKPE